MKPKCNVLKVENIIKVLRHIRILTELPKSNCYVRQCRLNFTFSLDLSRVSIFVIYVYLFFTALHNCLSSDSLVFPID